MKNDNVSSNLDTLLVHGEKAKALLLKATFFIVILSISIGSLLIAIKFDKVNQLGDFFIMVASVSNICVCVCIWKCSDVLRVILKEIDELRKK